VGHPAEFHADSLFEYLPKSKNAMLGVADRERKSTPVGIRFNPGCKGFEALTPGLIRG
jgi:hypothetical protein